MTALQWIIGACLAGGVLSVAAAALVALSAKPRHVPVLISYAIGTLLGAVFLNLLPEAFARADGLPMGTVVLGGILGFFTLEKLVLWRHCHEDTCESHGSPAIEHDHGRSGLMILVGDTIHNFVDGILIAAAFLADIQLGIVTALAMIAHEIPQEVGDFLILLNSGFSRAQAIAFNLLSSVATLVGGLLAYATLFRVQGLVPPLLGVAAASMLYVAVADLIPGLHRRPELQATIQQLALIALGVGTIWVAGRLFHPH
jgi:zinc and cadmium transporter